jgi:hypothetical protein
MEVHSCAKSDLEEEPRENLHLVQHTRAPDALPVHIDTILAAAQGAVGVSHRIRLARQLQDSLVRKVIQLHFL